MFPTDEDGVDGDDTKLRPPLIVDGRGFSQTEVFREAMFRVSNAKMSEEKNSNNWPRSHQKFYPSPSINVKYGDGIKAGIRSARAIGDVGGFRKLRHLLELFIGHGNTLKPRSHFTKLQFSVQKGAVQFINFGGLCV